MKLAGIVFIVGSAGVMGVRISLSLRKRCELLRQLLQALAVLRSEIAFCGTPLPQAFALMAVQCSGTLETIFSSAAKQMDRQRWMTPLQAMELAIAESRETFLAPILRELFAQLGRYDLEAQVRAVDGAQSRTKTLLSQLEQERNRKTGTYETLGICAGIAVAILLL